VAAWPGNTASGRVIHESSVRAGKEHDLRLHYVIAGWAVYFGVAPVTSGAVLRGMAKNGTTGQPAAGNPVMLMSLARGRTEMGRGKTDSSGRFEFAVEPTQAYVVHLVHQGVDYRTLAPAGVNSVEVQVYETAKKLDGVVAIQGTQRLQTAGDKLLVIDETTVRNTSNPPRTLANDRPFEIQLPPEAEIVAGKVQIGNEQPVIRDPSTTSEKDRYYFSVPLLPGDTRFAVAYRLPYRGEAVVQPAAVAQLAELVVVVPETMEFEPKSPGVFQPRPARSGEHVYGATARKQGQSLSFRISGAGGLAEAHGAKQPVQPGEVAARKSGLSGSTAPPIPVHDMRWFLLGGLGLIATAAIMAYCKRTSRK
jgi:hypothetical protein